MPFSMLQTLKKLYDRCVLRFWPILALFILVAALAATNYHPGTILSGWDNLHPEFDFALNIKRSVFAVWQEYQGLGLLGGMAHSSDLPRQIFLLFLSLVLPADSLRYMWTFLMLFVGASGAYFLFKKTVFTKDENQIFSFLGASFYLLNLATIQMFYAPFEAFSGFFGFLPWVLLASLLYFNSEKHSLKHLLFLCVVLLLATPAWYVQTFFIVFIMALSLILATFLVKNPSISSFKKAAKLYAIIFIINCFWLLPVAYFTLTNSQVNLNSKINQMATETIFLQNKEFVTLPDVMLLKGFEFKSVDPNSTGTINYMLKPWSDHLQNPFVAALGFLFFAIIFVGFIKAIRSKNTFAKSFAWLFIFSFIALAIDTPPFSFINNIFRNYLPLVNQIFRFPFTKFATLASLNFAMLFAIGVQKLVIYFEDLNIKNLKIKANFLPLIPFILLMLFIFPAFQGHLFYDKERTTIPKDYKNLFSYFKNQDPNTRIADFPHSNFWGWSFYDWPGESQNDPNISYGGSGFLWYGINQPIVDRNFDVWSSLNENYYFEVSQALYSKNPKNLEKVFNKYQINWILIDKNIFDVSSSKALFVPELEALIDKSSVAKKTAVFGKLEVYKIDLKDKPKSFVFMSKNLPTVNKYNWNNNDQAYLDNGNYIAANDPLTANTIYPFRSLFSLKTQKEKEFSIKETASSIDLTTQLPAMNKATLTLPSFVQQEKYISVKLSTQKTQSSGPKLVAKVLLPQVFLGNRELTQDNAPSFQLQLPTVKPEQYPLKVNVNGAGSFPVTNSDQDVGITFFILNAKNVFTISDSKKHAIGEIVFAPDIFSQLSKNPQSIALEESLSQTLTVKFPKIDDNYLSFNPLLSSAEKVKNCDSFRTKDFSSKTVDNKALTLSSTDATACTAFFANSLPTDQAFAIFIKSKYSTGQGLRFWVENINEQYAPIDTYLPKDTKTTTSSFILPPQELFGSSYAFHFDNGSIGRDKTVNEINKLSVYPIFYNYLESIKTQSGNAGSAESLDSSSLTVSHPNESLYTIQISNLKFQISNGTTLILSQSFNPGWKAYTVGNNNWFSRAFPFVFGKEIKNHVFVNNWENGWVLDKTQNPASPAGGSNFKVQIVIVYLPQYLEYFGFGLLIVVFGVVLIKIKRRSKKHSE